MSKRSSLPGCKNKVRYESYAAAGFFANADGTRPYRCPACEGFHLTSKGVRPRALHVTKKRGPE